MDVKHAILLLEDEKEAADMLANYLEMHNFEVLQAYDGKQAMEYITQRPDKIDLAILDIMVPSVNGMEICKRMRDNPILASVPIIFLTAKDQESDEISGLEAGADDYIAKPASFKLIEARVKSLLRRQPARSSGWLHFRNIYLDATNFEVQVDNQRVDLTHTEFRILELFLQQPNKVYTRQEILEHISDDQKFVFDRTVDVHVKNLRIKLGAAGEAIKTYRGTGYGMNREMAG
ncbi:DNA-binding response regulator, OmpR family, contains REC and winged-helix (wHTH) domain [Cyclonatronum proteinivorum]|uniref:DNA-binding response regulator, OmpR family, contains REC and winged-helix (WHTH) domain n=1 Tax=Cyclonatronum proteinivorum TaxID=1457365 RepID=A0A345UIN4_9BACT|nr:response regulator transcription factor [Cyclonatronum proteinivorum]AXJ00336.1 DNA-binding response regulator, OmpR family, contains REC and winged-helix (wHTH) domain [Cyclonatronum proteinivorum]